MLLPSDVATNLKELVEGTAGLCTAATAHAHVWREAARAENIDELSNVSLCDALCEGVLSEGIKRLCRTQQAVSQAAENVSGDVDEDAVARDREGASLAVKVSFDLFLIAVYLSHHYPGATTYSKKTKRT